MDDTSKAKILVVDDRPENLLAMDKLLRPLGATIHKVSSGEEALSEVLRYRFALILLDVQMPGMDGFETATLLRSNKQTARIPIIFVTAINKDQNYICKGYEAGAVDYLPKPINPDILLGKVKVFLTLEHQRQELEEVSRQLRWISTKNQLLLDSASEGIMGLDTSGHITFCNPAACELMGGSEMSITGEHISQFIFEGDKATCLNKWEPSELNEKCMKQGESVQHAGTLWKQEEGSFPVEYSLAPLLNDKRQVKGAVFIFKDITTRKELEDKLMKMAKYDSLTGLANRVLFKEFLHASMARSERREKHTAVMFLDLDHFKAINDTLGHDAGDELLIEVAKRLQTCIREGDMVARLGGDEFSVILDDVKQPEDARIVAEKILKAMLRPHVLAGEERNVGTSIGIAAYPDDGDSGDAVIKAADEAMYFVKKEGRNGYKFYADLANADDKPRFAAVKSVGTITTQKGLRRPSSPEQ
ncbi:diguanylate cyclase domain-containing protein [Candidatus Sororendozoicomonas aggregata]|uniref:diguanylate cyclase domain-containing protein n=1 Tax=Candidatus Sororendozoicomonas aggregata TaxID=3073239 RepID=UPI002ED0048D